MKRLILAAVAALATASSAGAQDLPPSEHIVGVGNFIHAVADLERSVTFYREGLGMDLQAAPNAPPPAGPRPYVSTPEILRLYDSVGGQYRVSATLIPNSPMRAEFIEFKDLQTRVTTRAIQDPGAGILVLTVRDVDAAFAQAKSKGAEMASQGDGPVRIRDEHGSARAVMVRDPDGFYVQLIQRDDPVPASAPAGNVVGVGFAVTVDDMDRTLHVYKDILGFKAEMDPTDRDAARLSLMNIPRAFYRRAWSIVPGTNFQVDFIEVHGLSRRQFRARPRDPGSAILRLRVADMDQAVQALERADLKVASAEGQPVTVNGANASQRFAILHTPDFFFVQLVQQLPAARPPN